MFAKRLLEKVTNLSPSSSSSSSSSQNAKIRSVAQTDLDPRVALHYGIPSTASILAFDPIQRLLAVGTLDGRIKVIGRDGIEGLLISPKQSSYKNLEFLHNKGFLVSISNENNIQVWDLEHMRRTCSFQWDSNITAFSSINGTYFMYVGDEWGLISVLKYSVEDGKLLQLPYHMPINCLAETAGVSVMYPQSVVGLLPQTFASDSRVVIAYEKGLIILWDISEARVVTIRGYKDLQMTDIMVVRESPKGLNNKIPDDKADHELEDKEISSLCWASSDGSVLAVGYVDGDIMLWNMSCVSSSKVQQSEVPSNNVVKLQLSSSDRRLPVIVLHWSASCNSDNGSGSQLFIYGGDEIGSEEVLTILSLEWSSGIETLRCVSRTELTLNGSFSDLMLVPNAEAMINPSDTLFVLTKPGHLHIYEDSILSSLSSQKEKRPSVPSSPFPVLVPTVAPCMTAAKLSLIPMGGNSSKMASIMKTGATPNLTTGSKCPVSGGVSSQSSTSKDCQVERLYMAGYQDGSVKIWDATYPVLSLMIVLESEVENTKVAGASTSVSALDFCPHTLSLAVGNDSGLVRVYKFSGNSGETELHSVFESKHEVSRVHQRKGLQCSALFSVLSSPVQTLNYVSFGAKLAVGFGCGRVGMFDMSSLSVLFLTDSMSDSSSPVISLIEKASPDISNVINSRKQEDTMNAKDPADVLFILRRDSCMFIMDCATGNIISSRSVHQKKESTSISMYIIESSISVSEASKENLPEQPSLNSPSQDDPKLANSLSEDAPKEATLYTSSETTTSEESSLDSFVLLCCEDALHLFSLNSALKGDYDSVCKISLAKPCCWTTTFKRKDEKARGLALLYQTGVIEIRSLPDLEVVSESSIASILRWSFKANMEKTICSLDHGLISLVNGSELAFISLLASENDFRIPESLPSLHDKVLAVAADAAIKLSANQKKEGTSSGIFGLIKGIKGEKPKSDIDLTEHLESIFSKPPFPDPSETIDDILELNIDDIEIEGPILVTSTAPNQGKNDKRDKETEREKLFQGATSDTKPRLRNPDEIKAKYRKAGDVSAVASQARDKLVQRGEKLERLTRNTEELQSGSENFASMASELVKAMEAKKWWKL